MTRQNNIFKSMLKFNKKYECIECECIKCFLSFVLSQNPVKIQPYAQQSVEGQNTFPSSKKSYQLLLCVIVHKVILMVTL